MRLLRGRKHNSMTKLFDFRRVCVSQATQEVTPHGPIFKGRLIHDKEDVTTKR